MCEGTWRCAALIEPKAVRTSRPWCVDSSPMAAVKPYELQVSALSVHPIAPETDWIQPPMCGWWSSRARGGAFSSAPGMLLCPRLSSPPRLPPAPPALLLEAAWYIASLTSCSFLAVLLCHPWFSTGSPSLAQQPDTGRIPSSLCSIAVRRFGPAAE